MSYMVQQLKIEASFPIKEDKNTFVELSGNLHEVILAGNSVQTTVTPLLYPSYFCFTSLDSMRLMSFRKSMEFKVRLEFESEAI